MGIVGLLTTIAVPNMQYARERAYRRVIDLAIIDANRALETGLGDNVGTMVGESSGFLTAGPVTHAKWKHYLPGLIIPEDVQIAFYKHEGCQNVFCPFRVIVAKHCKTGYQKQSLIFGGAQFVELTSINTGMSC